MSANGKGFHRSLVSLLTLMSAALPASLRPSVPSPVLADQVAPARGAAPTRSAPAPAAARQSRSQRQARALAGMGMGNGPLPPWVNKDGELLRSIRRNVHAGGHRA
jgi:hypothetical protein